MATFARWMPSESPRAACASDPAAAEPYQPPSCSVDDADALATAIEAAGHVGLLQLTDVPVMPFGALQTMFDDLHTTGGSGGNCYPAGLALKDAHSLSETADEKRMVDLNPQRLGEAEAALAENKVPTAASAAFRSVVDFWRQCEGTLAPKLRAAMSASDATIEDDHLEFRMLDYYERPGRRPSRRRWTMMPPRRAAAAAAAAAAAEAAAATAGAVAAAAAARRGGRRAAVRTTTLAASRSSSPSRWVPSAGANRIEQQRQHRARAGGGRRRGIAVARRGDGAAGLRAPPL